MNRFRIAVLLVALAGLCLACNGQSGPEALQERAQAYWDSRVAQDFARSYSYLDPAWRAGFSMEQWVGFSQGIIEWTRADVRKAVVHGRTGSAYVEYDFRIVGGLAAGESGTKVIDEAWLLVDGKWYKARVEPFRTPSPPDGWEDEE
jgi:hypothetical protein